LKNSRRLTQRLLFLIVIFLVIILAGCKSQSNQESDNSLPSPSYLVDSIKMMDSLVLCYRISNEKLALQYAKTGLRLANRLNTPDGFVTAWNALGNVYNSGRKDSSFYYYSRAIRLIDSCRLFSRKPRTLLNLAIIYIDASNFKLGTTYVDSTIFLAEKFKQPKVLADAYNTLGEIRLAGFDSLGAKQAFENALSIATGNNLQRQAGNALANIALFESNPVKSQIDLVKALRCYQGLAGLEEEKALICINIGYLQVIPDSAIRYYKASLQLAESGGSVRTIISAYNNLAYAYLDKHDILKAKIYLETAIPKAVKLKNSDWIATLYDTYADVMMEEGNFAKAVIYQKQAYKSRIIADNERSVAQVRLLSAMLDLRNKDAKIRQNEIDIETKRAENLILKLFVVISLITIMALLSLFFWYKQRAQLIKAQTQMNAASRIIELEEMEKRRLGFELHDHVGYLIRSVSQFIQDYEFSDVEEKKEIVAMVSDLRVRVRRFSHQMNPINLENENFPNLVGDLIKDFSTISAIRVNYFISEYFPVLKENTTLHLIRIIQELLNNNSKHAFDSNVTLNITTIESFVIIVYKDDGPGFDASIPDSSGFGFQSINERVRLLEGKCRLISSPGTGVHWEFEIPF
jgi:two-component system NarL family sensor kinase